MNEMDSSGRKSSVPVSDSYFLKVDAPGSGGSSRSPSPNTSIKGLSFFRMISRKIGKNARKAKEVTISDEDDDSNSSSNSLSRKKENSETNECDCDYYYNNDRNILMISTKNRSNSFTDNSGKREKSKLNNEYQRSERCLRFSTPCNGYHHSSGSDAYSSNDDSSNSNDDHPTTVHFSSNDSSSSSASSGTSYRNSRAIVRKVLKSFNLNSRSLSCSSISQMKDIGDRRDVKEKRTKKSPQKILRQPVSYTYVRGISGLPTHRVVNTRGCYNNQYSRG